MAYKVRMPSMGAMMEEGTILSWKVKEGELVGKGQLLFEFESDKSAFSYESPVEGVLLKILIPEGQKAAVGSGIAILGEPGENLPPETADEPLSEKAVSPEESQRPSSSVQATLDNRARAKISPRARKLAEQLKVDISTLQGSGPGGRIESADVELAFREGQKAPDARAFSAVRRQIQKTVILSKREIPHFYLDSAIDMTQVQITRGKYAARGVKLSYNAFFLRAAANALKAVPVFCQFYTERGSYHKDAFHISIAIETPAGVRLSVIKDVDLKDLVQLTNDLTSAIHNVRNGATQSEGFETACISISNLGMYRVERLIPIIPPGQSAIIGIGRISDRPAVVDGSLLSRPMMTATMSVDHRIADGADAARFLETFAASLESEDHE